MDPVVHFEMPYEDAERHGRPLPVRVRLADRALEGDMSGCLLAHTAESDEIGPKVRGVRASLHPAPRQG